jgi:hypothetical protein
VVISYTISLDVAPRQTAFMIADAVRYMSVHSWKQPDSNGRSGTLPVGKATAREPETSQLTGRFRRQWQVMDSNQRRLSRRFYRPILLYPAQAGCLRKRRPGPED